jgi:hypothetical protein
MMGSGRGASVADTQLQALSDLVIASSSDRLKDELAALHAERERLATATSEFEAVRAEHDQRDAALRERAEALDKRDADSQARARALADERAVLDRVQAESGEQTAAQKREQVELDRARSAFKAEVDAFGRAKAALLKALGA